MPKGVEKQQLNNATTAQNLSSLLEGNAGAIYGGLEPAFQAEATHPGGYTPTQKAAMNTAAQQSSGGSQAGTVGQGALYSARTKNAGAAQNAIGAGTRGAGANLSREAVGNEVANADLQQHQQAEGLRSLGGLYGTEAGTGLGALNASDTALQGAAQSAADNPWLKVMQSVLGSGAQAYTGYEGVHQ